MKTAIKYKRSTVWDYDISHLNLADKMSKIWYLQRLVDENDFKNIDWQELKKYLKKLKINKYKRLILNYYLNATK